MTFRHRFVLSAALVSSLAAAAPGVAAVAPSPGAEKPGVEASLLAGKYHMTPAEAQAWLDRTPVLDDLERRLASRLPDRFAGIWTEGGRRVRIAVVGAGRPEVDAVVTAELGRRDLAAPVTVRPAAVSLRQLRQRADTAAAALRGRRTAEIEVSVPRNTVVVRVPRSSGPAARTTLGALAGSVRVEETMEDSLPAACFSTQACTPTHGGSYIRSQGTGKVCSFALPARSAGGIWYAITAGHCIPSGSGSWEHANIAIGPNVRWEFGDLGPDGDSYGTDIGAIRYASNLTTWNPRSRVIVTTSQATVVSRPITAAMETRTGDPACMTGGRSTYTDCGAVESPNTYVTYSAPGLPSRTVYDLTSVTDICLRPGDSGSPVFTGDRILGVGVTYNTACTRIHFARIAVALSKYKLSIIP